jgi:tetratricopeptide (TPR) repeat protein
MAQRLLLPLVVPALLALAAGAQGPPPVSPALALRDAAEEAGLAFVHENSPTPRKHLIETMPGGLALFDYDGDGRVDVFFTNGAEVPSLVKSSPRHSNRLYRNLGGLRFADVTEAAGLGGVGYAMAVAVGDYDNDGDPDLYVGGVHRQQLLRNTGGRFEDITAAAGLASGQWVVGAGFFDHDNDGWLDLLAVNYTVWTAQMDRFCGDSARGIRVYCHPRFFEPVASSLYRNRGDGRFEDVSAASGIALHKGRGMGLAFADYDRDGRVDVYVANDKLPSFLFRNLGDGRFEENALRSGSVLPEHGQDISAMGVDFRDYDNDGLPDIHVTALAGESFPLYRNLGQGLFQDATYRSRLGAAVAARSGWGNGLVDLDNDGFKDLFTANSHVNDAIDRFESRSYRETNSVFRNLGDGTFEDLSAASGLSAGPRRAHRGAAFADLDGDGRVDAVVTALAEPAELWRNESPAGHWLELRLVGTKSNRDGTGAVVKLQAASDPRWREQWNHATSAFGYASASAGPLHFGIGHAKTIDRVEIRWPSGTLQVLENVAADQVLTVRETPVLAEGVRLGETGDPEASIREHLRALELDPGLTKAHANLMALYGEAEKWDKVDEHHRAAVAQAPGLVELHYNYALALQQQKRPAEAQQALRRRAGAEPAPRPGPERPRRAPRARGPAFFDYDNDGWLDILVAKRGCDDRGDASRHRLPLPREEPAFRNPGRAPYQDTSSEAGPALARAEVSRGAAFGDVDNDGDIDVLVTNDSGPVRLLLSDAGGGQHWAAGVVARHDRQCRWPRVQDRRRPLGRAHALAPRPRGRQLPLGE